MKRIFFHLFAVAITIFAAPAQANFPFDLTKLSSGTPESAPSETKKLPEEADVTKARDAALAEQQQVEQTLAAAATSGLPDVEAQYLQARLQTLERQGVVYSELLETFGTLKRVQDRNQSLEPILQDWRAGTPPKDFVVSFDTLDKLQGQAVDFEKNLKSRNQIYEARQKALEDARAGLETAEGKRRQAKEEAENATEPDDKVVKDHLRSLAELNSRLAQAQVQLRELELQVSKQYRKLGDKQRELNTLQLAYLQKRVAFDQGALDAELKELESEKSQIIEALNKDQKTLTEAGNEYVKARQRLDNTPQPPPFLVEEVEAKRLRQNLLEQRVDFNGNRIKLLKERETMWKQRFKLLSNKATRSEIEGWEENTRQALDQIDRDANLISLRLNSARNSVVDIQNKITSKAGSDPATLQWLRMQQDSTEQNLEELQSYQAFLLVSRSFDEKFLYEQEKKVAHVSWRDRLSQLWDGFLRFWNFEVTSVDDSPITVGKILVALILVLFGTLLARRMSRMLGEKVLPRFGVASGVAAALRTLCFYLLFLFFFIVALNMVRVPLTIFTVLGGAIAIGIGFGSQNLMNNFISGLILLIERPIKVGDIIEMESATGTVERIGGRSTQIRTADNTQYIIPNSSFLEKPVVNWTLSDDLVRSAVRVGVAYGSSTRKIAEVLKKAADSHGKVLKTPQPVANFSDFGPDALIFDLLYWVRMRSMSERREVESDLRYIIDNLFREADITIAYPQRDIHLHTTTPIDVKVSQAAEKTESQE
ncbi:MAG TPA: mechanosensitive ion channel domain-containing protein [bacterium]|nr:mechanosensitive ion channel domain-containing protein [bacterium]